MDLFLPVPDKVSICFLSGDSAIADSQWSVLSSVDFPFDLCPYFRYERGSSLYQTFSQIINECIDESEQEFMIFVNPKTLVSPSDISFIVDKLCSGFCFVSVFGMAFCGFTKELVREIGMMDEGFLSGEYEDNDFLVRIRRYGKAVHWGQDWSKYGYYPSSCPPNRGCSVTHFWRKWRWKDGVLVDSPLSSVHKVVSRRHSSHREDIKSSWLGYGYSWGEGDIWNMVNGCRLVKTSISESFVNGRIDVRMEFRDGSFLVEMISDVDTAISVTLVTPMSDGRLPLIPGKIVYSNNWFSHPIQDRDLEVRLYHDGSLIYMNGISPGHSVTMAFNLPCSVLV